jgi:hypothetical protein
MRNVTAATQTATHCRVSITLRPSADSEIKSEVWLPPAAAWNGKFLMDRVELHAGHARPGCLGEARITVFNRNVATL